MNGGGLRKEVIVIGAGPVGLSLALILARTGRKVHVVEKNDSTSERSRAPAIWPATQEILNEMGIVDRFLEHGITHPELKLWDADRSTPLIRVPLHLLADKTAFPQLLILPQSETERLLLEALERESAATVLFGCEAMSICQNGQSVTVQCRRNGRTESLEGRFVIGCDGAHSTVRESLGATFEGITYKLRAALADIEFEEANDMASPRLTTRPRSAIGIRIQPNTWRLILPFSEVDEISLEQRVEDAVASLFNVSTQTVWKSEFKLHRRVSSTFARGRVALAGDAAHLNSPVGGQGMNAGIKDASVLSQALIEALDTDSTRPILDYASRRKQEIESGVNAFTNILTKVLLFRRGKMLRPAFRLANLLLRFPPTRRRALQNISMLD